jgi:hypothetical protein
MFVITDVWLMQHSRAAAWTRDQLSCIAVEWPPQRGWKWRAIGQTISDEQKARFEKGLRAKRARGAATLDLFG